MLALTVILACLACTALAAPHMPSRTVQKREPHPAVLTLPTPGTEFYVMVESNYPVGYFEFPFVMTDGEDLSPYARVVFQNSTGMYPVGENVPGYNAWTFEAILKSSLTYISVGDYTLIVQEGDPSTGEWNGPVVSVNVSVYSEICGSDPTCCWSCTT
ncbi:hypothetical protein CALCODRAFT_520211 [Calocera cornea HHB12733]|uniref:Uncharacterized protein n=1 Tax=Calocera cornea HHB12733 TaxID=1353952 RepID=A0A165DP03_9BASI|nr:hypothetical protein CALCODRAFT_520211 [Calocera cornea HHB12733]